MKKPPWFDKKIDLTLCREMKKMLKQANLNTVCQEAICPNISECFNKRTATFLILGDICTRDCKFCSVIKGRPFPLDENEPQRLKQAVQKLDLTYVVITSPTRDDLPDQGVSQFCQAVETVKTISTDIKIELLIPDLMGRPDLLKYLAFSGAQVIGHNLETCHSLYGQVRAKADYNRSLSVLKTLKEQNKSIFTKSSLILGLGEKSEEVIGAIDDLRKIDCDFITFGQYLPPKMSSFPLKEYISLERFAYYREYSLNLGFKGVKSGPYVRSSYSASALYSGKKG